MGLLDVSSRLNSSYTIFGRNTTGVMFCPPYSIGMHMISISAITDNSGHLAKLVSAKFLYHKVIIFPFVINKYLVGRYLETKYISCVSLYFCSVVLASFDDSCQK